MRSIVVFLVLLFAFLLNCVLVVCLVLYFSCSSGVKVPVGYLCCLSGVFPVFCLRTFSSHCYDCLHFLLGFLFIVVLQLFCLCPTIVLPSVLNPRAAPRCGQITESTRFSCSSSCRKQLSSKYPQTLTAFFYHHGCEQKEAEFTGALTAFLC